MMKKIRTSRGKKVKRSKDISWMKEEGIRMKVYMSLRLLIPISTYHTLPYLPK